MSKTIFTDLLRSTSAALPASDPEITAFLQAHQTKIPKRPQPSPAAMSEWAAGVLWLHTLSANDDDDVANVVALPLPKKKILASLLQIQGPEVEPVEGWPKLIIRRAHAYMVGGQSPTKRPRARSRNDSGGTSRDRSRHDDGRSVHYHDSDERPSRRRRRGRSRSGFR
jgi:hypothetical protein